MTLVVGGGFIGSHVARQSAALGSSVRVLTRTRPTSPILERMQADEVLVGDAASGDLLKRALDDAARVVWSAGGLMPAESTRAPAADLLSTTAPFLKLLDELKDRTVPLIYISSGGTVYGDPPELPVAESYVPRPISAHGVSRLAAEHYFGLYRDVHGLRGTALRCANVYGVGQRSDRSQGLIAVGMERCRRGGQLNVFGDGSTVRDYVHVDDVARVTLDLADRDDLPRAVNVGSGVGASVNDVLDELRHVTGRPLEIVRDRQRPGDANAVVLDIALLRSLMKFDPTPLRAGLERTWKEW